MLYGRAGLDRRHFLFYRWVSRCAPAIVAATVFAGVSAGEEGRSLESNAIYRLSWGDMGSAKVAPLQSRRAIRLEEGSEELLQICQANPDHWRRDPLFFRFGHGHAFSTIGCRERSTPSVHVVFYRQPDGTRQAWMHFDLHGPQSPLPHLTEVFRNRLTFGRTSEYDVYRGLVKNDPIVTEPQPAPRYDFKAHFQEYERTILGIGAVGGPLASATSVAALRMAFDKDPTMSDYGQHIAKAVMRNSVRESIEFGVAAMLQQDEKMLSSNEHGFARRARAAMYHSFFVAGRDGDELAFPRLAAAFGTAMVMHDVHPFQQKPLSLSLQTSLNLAHYVVRSYWQEFGPDLMAKSRKFLHRNEELGQRLQAN